MLRVIVRTVDCGAAANVGGPVETRFKTFDIDQPDLEQHLRMTQQYATNEVIGVELLYMPAPETDVTAL